jgi:hypothetical protein
MVPKWLQRALWAAYEPGQETTKVVSGLYLVVQLRCRLAIATAEGFTTEPLRADLGEALRLRFLAHGLREAETADHDYLIEEFDMAIRRRFS